MEPVGVVSDEELAEIKLNLQTASPDSGLSTDSVRDTPTYPQKLSASRLNKLAQCGWLYHAAYKIDKKVLFIPPTSPENLIIGNVVHSVADRYFSRWLRCGRRFSPESAHKIARDEWRTQLEILRSEGNNLYQHCTPQEVEKLRQFALNLTETYIREIGCTVKPWAIEYKFDLSMPGLFAPVMGYMDQVGDGWVRDIKTKKSKRVTKGDVFQAHLYAWAYEQIFGDIPKVYLDVVTKTKKTKAHVIDVTPSRKDINDMLYTARKRADRIDKNMLEMVDSCNFCTVNLCPVYNFCKGWEVSW